MLKNLFIGGSPEPSMEYHRSIIICIVGRYMDRTYSRLMFDFSRREIDDDGHTIVGRIRVEKKLEKTRFSNIREKPVNVVIIVYYYYLPVAAISTASTKIVIMSVVRTSHTNTRYTCSYL